MCGAFDGMGDGFASKTIPAHNLVAEYWIDPLDDHNDTSDAGIYLYIGTDQVRFVREGEPLPL